MTTEITEADVLSPALRERLTELELSPDGLGVRVGGNWVFADATHRLCTELGAALYEVWHAGVVPDGDRRMPRRCPETEAALTAVVPHAESPAQAVVHEAGADSDEEPVVEIGQVRVRVPRGAIATDGTPLEPGTRVTVRIPAVRPALSPGFLLVHGPRGGLVDRTEVLRLYVHVTDAGHAPGLWGTTLRALGDAGIRYQAKILSRPWSYPRQDALVVYLEAGDADTASHLVEALQGRPGLGGSTSCFTHRLAPGLAVAFDPRDTELVAGRQSFGQHRALATARGVVRHATAADGTNLALSVAEALRAAGADPAEPARNLSSPRLPRCGAEDAR